MKTASDFDSAMSKVAAVSGATGDDLQKLRDKAREMGSKTKFSASEAAEAMNYMAMAGWKTNDMLSGIDGIMNLAAASGEDLATTSDIVTDALTAFGLTAQDSGHFADVLAAASSNANTNMYLCSVNRSNTVAFSTLGAAIGGISAPVVAVVAIIATLVAAFVYLWNTNEDFKNSILSIWEQIKSTFERLISGIVDRINALGFDFQNFGEMLKAMWNGLCSMLAPVFEGVFQHILDIFTFVVDTILSVLDVFIGLFSGNWEQCWNGIKGIFTGIWDFVVNQFSNILNTVRDVADVFLGWFGTYWNEVLTSINDFFATIFNIT